MVSQHLSKLTPEMQNPTQQVCEVQILAHVFYLKEINQMKEEILFMLKEQREAIDKAIDYIELHSISKVDLLLEMQQMNTKEENVPAVKNLYEKFFREPKDEEHEEER